ncbi:MAG: Hsp70 family protein, partial [Deltaproteobacteria bacterium]|nr:Hsp70 family protein [Deltaproteobacteria bacterium]
VRIINEPTAASLVYDYASLRGEGNSPDIMVYDLVGGTFDVSILEIKGEIKEVLASCGDTVLGGDDFDERVANSFLRHLKEKTGFDFSGSPKAFQVRLRDIAEKAKITLSDAPYARVQEVAVTTLNGQPVNLDLDVSRREYEEMIADLVEKTILKVGEALKEANLSARDMGKIILVGGATRTPLVQRRLAEVFDRPIHHSIDPDLCVALGAAVQSGLIAGEPLGHILLDVTAHSLGLKTIDFIDEETGDADYFSVIIPRNTKVPVRKAEVYYTVRDFQEGVEVEVYQGESASCRENTRIGKFYFTLKPAAAHSPVTVEFAYDREGVVHVTIDQKGAENRQEVTLDVRKKRVLQREGGAEGPEVLNYILEKSRRLIREEKLPPDLRRELTRLSLDYETALREQGEDRDIDDLEDRLLERMEEAEERLLWRKGRYWDWLALVEKENLHRDHAREEQEAWMSLVKKALRLPANLQEFWAHLPTVKRYPSFPDFQCLRLLGDFVAGKEVRGELAALRNLTFPAESLRQKALSWQDDFFPEKKIRSCFGAFLHHPEKVTWKDYQSLSSLAEGTALGAEIAALGSRFDGVRGLNRKTGGRKRLGAEKMRKVAEADRVLKEASKVLAPQLQEILFY